MNINVQTRNDSLPLNVGKGQLCCLDTLNEKNEKLKLLGINV